MAGDETQGATLDVARPSDADTTRALFLFQREYERGLGNCMTGLDVALAKVEAMRAVLADDRTRRELSLDAWLKNLPAKEG